MDFWISSSGCNFTPFSFIMCLISHYFSSDLMTPRTYLYAKQYSRFKHLILLRVASCFLPSNRSRILFVSAQNYMPVKFSNLFLWSWVNHASSSCYEFSSLCLLYVCPFHHFSIHHFVFWDLCPFLTLDSSPRWHYVNFSL